MRNFLYLLSLLFFLGCTTSTSIKDLDQDEILELDEWIGSRLERNFSQHVVVKSDKEIRSYLEGVTSTLLLSAVAQPLGNPIPDVKMIETKFIWRSYSFPVAHIFLSLEMLKQFEFENEVASEIAVQIAHLVNKFVLVELAKNTRKNDSKESHQDFQELYRALTVAFGGSGRDDLPREPEKFMNFSYDQEMLSLKMAVAILYQSGFDPRALLRWGEIYRKNITHSPFDAATMNRLIDGVWKEIALYPPLRNPVVRTQKYGPIQQRLRKL